MKPSMKIRNFYPLQVLRRLNGKDATRLSPGQRAALEFFMRRHRRYGVSMTVINEAPVSEIQAADSADAVEAVKAQYPSRIRVLWK